jgi:HNH endonuclease
MARRNLSDSIKKLVIDRAKGVCEYCRSQLMFSPNSFEIDHLFPVSQGGDNALDNLALACPQCNGHKSNKTYAIDPISAQSVPLFNPREMNWEEHFIWSDDTRLMIGVTPIGRATVTLLQTNRENVVNLRQVLRQMGFHPSD